MESSARLVINEKTDNYYQCQGKWSIDTLAPLMTYFNDYPLPEGASITISGKQITYFDSAGALALQSIISKLQEKNNSVELIDLSHQQQSLIELIHTKKDNLSYQILPPKSHNIAYRIGLETTHKLAQANGLLILIGDLCAKTLATLTHRRPFRLAAMMSNINSAGIQALPIVALLSFLIGVVLAYQMGLQLKTYGANIFIAYLSGMAIFREFAPLITAIIVAGRTSSAFTAQLGSMTINEEVDALKTMGLSPTELLVMPKVLGLMLVFPLLIFWADFFSLMGAMFMSKWMLDVNYLDFLVRIKDSVGLSQLMLGLYKAPAFSLIIALVGCFQGFAVKANAASIGTQTTKSVVQALFLIIIADAAFSIAYSWAGL